MDALTDDDLEEVDSLIEMAKSERYYQHHLATTVTPRLVAALRAERAENARLREAVEAARWLRSTPEHFEEAVARFEDALARLDGDA